MRDVKSGWLEYAALLPAGASKTQLRETEQAFYGGIVHAFSLLIENSELPDDDAERNLEAMLIEARARFRAILDSKFAEGM
jgi:hypothetical protein